MMEAEDVNVTLQTEGVQRFAIQHGWLTKRAIRSKLGGLAQNWRRRYVVLIEDELQWYDSADLDECAHVTIRSQRLGSMPLDPSTIIDPNVDVTKLSVGPLARSETEREFCFSVRTGNKMLVLQAGSAQDRSSWIGCLYDQVHERRSTTALSMKIGTPWTSERPASPVTSHGLLIDKTDAPPSPSRLSGSRLSVPAPISENDATAPDEMHGAPLAAHPSARRVSRQQRSAVESSGRSRANTCAASPAAPPSPLMTGV